MFISRRHILALASAAIALSLPAISLAQPSKKLTLLVGFPAGGAPDTVARALAEGLRGQGYTTIVENKSGAGGRLATDTLLTAPADGDTVLLVPT